MNHRASIGLLIAVSIIGTSFFMPAGLMTMQPPGFVGVAEAAASPIALRMNIGDVDPVIDPSYAGNVEGPENFLVHQLFLGLFRIDEDTGDVLPELATGYTMNTGATEFTIDMRTDAVWTDATSVTAADVRYGILRTLDPNLYPAPDYIHPQASLLYLIENAEDYNTGVITNPDLVGIEVLSAYQIRFTLNSPAAYFPTLLAMPFTKAMPQDAIIAHPSDWTEPGNIVTSGAYKLSLWSHGTYMELVKNEDFYASAGVQIDKISLSMMDEYSAWDAYQAGQLDTVIVPVDEWGSNWNDGASWESPFVQSQLRLSPRQGTYYYGFNEALAPFDNPLVRKAFIAAVDREGLIENTVDYASEAALTFTAPGVFGHVDGFTEGVGITYNPTQAQTWLASAGYPGGVGLPSITLDYNDDPAGGNEAIALYIAQNWYDNLGVSVTTNGHSVWPDYQAYVNSGASQVWRMGWVADFSDAYNFLYDGVVAGKARHGGWTNTTYETHLSNALTAATESARRAEYEAAEEILVETDAMLAPLYYYGVGVASSPYLERTYGNFGWGGRVAEWRLWRSIVTPAEDVVEGINFNMVPVTLEIDNDDNPGNGVLYTETATAEPAPTGLPLYSIVRFTVGHAFDILPGQHVRMTDGTTSTEQVVGDLAVTDVDPSGDTVSGSAAEGSEILVWPNDCFACKRKVDANSSDAWSADLSGDYDVVEGSEGFAWQLEEDGLTQALWLAEVPGWTKVAVNGFWNHDSLTITAITDFGGDLYAGASNGITGAQLWRMGSPWNRLVGDGFGDASNVGINGFAEFGGDLYAATWADEVSGGELWRSPDGDSWSQVVDSGFGDPTNAEVTALAVYGTNIYAGTWSASASHGAEIWRSGTGDAGDWTRVVSDGLGDSENFGVLAFEEFNGYLYASIGNSNAATGGNVWRSASGDGGTWSSVSTPGFGDTGNGYVSGLAAFNGGLYAISHHASGAGAEVWRCIVCNNTDWERVVDNGFGDSNLRRMPALEVVDGWLYAVVGHYTEGLEVWRTLDGNTWDRVSLPGFGDPDNTSPMWDFSVHEFGDQLYVGTYHYWNGGELWRMLDNGVSVDPAAASKPGLPGATVKYTLQITNEGEMTDTYDVTISGETWTTTSAATIGPIAPGASMDLEVEVTIPPAASPGDSDAVTVTLTSQADVVETAEAVLTTWAAEQVFLPLITR